MGNGVRGGWSWLFGLVTSIEIMKSVTRPSPDFQVPDLPWMLMAATALFMFGAFLVGSRHVVCFLFDRLIVVVSGVEKKAKLSLMYYQNLKKLGISFIGSRYETWFKEMKRTAETMALSEAGMSPESTFVLFSHPTSLDQNGVPLRSNSATYIFSNGHVTAVKK